MCFLASRPNGVQHAARRSALIARVLTAAFVQAPASLSDALIYFGAGYHGFQRTRLAGPGCLAAAEPARGIRHSFHAIAIRSPLVFAHSKPFIFVILATLLLTRRARLWWAPWRRRRQWISPKRFARSSNGPKTSRPIALAVTPTRHDSETIHAGKCRGAALWWSGRR